MTRSLVRRPLLRTVFLLNLARCCFSHDSSDNRAYAVTLLLLLLLLVALSGVLLTAQLLSILWELLDAWFR